MLVDVVPRHSEGGYRSGLGIDLIQNGEGILMLYDIGRSKWLSISREFLTFGIDHSNLQSNHWMMTHNRIRSNIEGYYVCRNLTITLICVKTENKSTGQFEIMNKNNNIYTVELNNESNKSINNLNIDLSVNDSISILINVVKGKIDYPTVILETAWKN